MVLRMAQAGTAGSLRERRVESLAAVRQAPADERERTRKNWIRVHAASAVEFRNVGRQISPKPLINLNKMAVVQLRERKWRERGRKRPSGRSYRAPWFGRYAGSGRIPRAFGPDERGPESRDRRRGGDSNPWCLTARDRKREVRTGRRPRCHERRAGSPGSYARRIRRAGSARSAGPGPLPMLQVTHECVTRMVRIGRPNRAEGEKARWGNGLGGVHTWHESGAW